MSGAINKYHKKYNILYNTQHLLKYEIALILRNLKYFTSGVSPKIHFPFGVNVSGELVNVGETASLRIGIRDIAFSQ